MKFNKARLMKGRIKGLTNLLRTPHSPRAINGIWVILRA